MEIRTYGTKKILIADTNKHIRSINDVYIPEKRDKEGNIIEYESFPYYTSVIFLADNFDESKLNELYVEEEIEKEE